MHNLYFFKLLGTHFLSVLANLMISRCTRPSSAALQLFMIKCRKNVALLFRTSKYVLHRIQLKSQCFGTMDYFKNGAQKFRSDQTYFVHLPFPCFVRILSSAWGRSRRPLHHRVKPKSHYAV